MKQKLFVLIFLILLVAVLAGLNAASYVQKEKTPDRESQPNRSSFNSGATGTQAFYALLSETGRHVMRWQDSPGALLTAKKDTPAVFVLIGSMRREFTDPEYDDLLRWVADGGRLVVIDRNPSAKLLTTTANWKLDIESTLSFSLFSVDPTDQKEMTGTAAAIKPIQPSVLSQRVNAVQPSQFSSSIVLGQFADANESGEQKRQDKPPPPPRSTTIAAEVPNSAGPVIHISDGSKNIVVDAPYGEGSIVFVADPYIVSNGGIAIADNAQLAINLAAAGDRIVAFDEYHQGYGNDSNRFLQFFAGTPVVAIFLQMFVIIGFVLFSQSRRFGRPVPEPEPDRLTKLEYVGAMAELQGRTRAYDLAIENIYNEFRRRASRMFGLDNFKADSTALARSIAERTGLDVAKIADDLFKCEEIIRGEPTNKRETVKLIEAIRELEKKLGITRAGRTRI